MTHDPPATLAETHSAVLVLFGDRAYKVKKPVDLGFLDFSTRQRREEACHREVRLNRRMAEDVYLGVADVTGPDGELCDHLVVMRRLPDEERMSTLVTAGARHPTGALVGRAPVGRAPRRQPRRGPLRRRGAGSRRCGATGSRTSQCWPTGPRRSVPTTAPIASSTSSTRYLRGRDALFEERIATGCVVDGHGDLRAEDIFVTPDGPRVLDCLDFSDELRWGDRLLDAAFLAMDLDDLGRPDLAGAFLAWQRELSGDTWPESLAHHYVAYRASVRAKVAAIKAAQHEDPAAVRGRAVLRAHRPAPRGGTGRFDPDRWPAGHREVVAGPWHRRTFGRRRAQLRRGTSRARRAASPARRRGRRGALHARGLAWPCTTRCWPAPAPSCVGGSASSWTPRGPTARCADAPETSPMRPPQTCTRLCCVVPAAVAEARDLGSSH